MLNLFVFLFGLAIGSFLNCVIYRLEKKQSFLKGRSYCPHCRHILSWQDLIPVFSFLILRGKCRYCQKKISWQYPLAELATGILFILIFNFLIFNFVNNFLIFKFLFWILISCFLIIIFVYDLKHYIIPDKVIYPAILLTLGFRICDFIGNWELGIGNLGAISNYFGAALGGAMFFLMIVLISRGKWMGVGDIKLAFLIGLLLGWPNTLLALFLAFLIGAIIGLGLIILKKKTIKSELPFGPFLILGIYIALFFGEKMINWYLSLFLI
ncbi:MAG: prepilin peptidase [bacterium]|nr:prepilin peptidase [bacterium]